MLEYFLAASIIIAIFLYLTAVITNQLGAPFVGLEPEVVKHVLELANLKPGQKFYDLGSGDGRLVIAAGLAGAKATGIEIELSRVLYSRLMVRLFGLSKTCRILHQNVFLANLKDADVVHLYLLQHTNDKIYFSLRRQLKPGTLIISSAFSLPGFKLLKTDPHGPIYGPLRLYQV